MEYAELKKKNDAFSNSSTLLSINFVSFWDKLNYFNLIILELFWPVIILSSVEIYFYIFKNFSSWNVFFFLLILAVSSAIIKIPFYNKKLKYKLAISTVGFSYLLPVKKKYFSYIKKEDVYYSEIILFQISQNTLKISVKNTDRKFLQGEISKLTFKNISNEDLNKIKEIFKTYNVLEK